MTWQPPRPSLTHGRPRPADLLATEIAQEQAAALGRLGRALEVSLRALAQFDARRSTPGMNAAARRERAALVADAASMLWQFVVQREACGLRDSRQIMRDYRVPAEVQAGMGAFPLNAAPGRGR